MEDMNMFINVNAILLELWNYEQAESITISLKFR